MSTIEALHPLRVSILSGYASPQTLEFDGSQQVLRIGRAADAELRLDPTRDTQASRGVHARLTLDGDAGWALECDHPSGVGIVGAGERIVRRLTAGERVMVRSDMTFEIGAGGPRLRATDPNAPLPGTVVKDAGTAVVPHVPRDVITRSRTTARRLVIVATVGILACVAIVVAVMSTGRDARQRAEQVREEAAAQSFAIGSAVEDFKGDLVRLEGRLADRMDETIERIRESVWLVGVADAEGRFTPVGSAWTATGDMLATNVHVVDALEAEVNRVGAGASLVGQSGNRRVDLAATGPSHPAYRQWSGTGSPFDAQFRGTAGGGTARISLIPPGDVALLRVASGDPGTPLTLREPGSLRRGMPVGYAGYPMENVAGLPSLQTVTGRITAMTDFFFGDDPTGENLLIHYDAVVTGGASGSPLVDADGLVIGIVSAGSMAPIGGGRRVPIGLNYAQCVTLLRELLDGSAESAQAARTPRWATRLAESTLSPPEMLDHLIAGAAGGRTPEVVETASPVLAGAGEQGAARLTVTAEAGNRYIVGAVARDWTDIDIVVFDGSDLIAKDDELDWYPITAFGPFDSDRQITILIVASPPLRSAASETIVRVVRLGR